MDQSSSSSIPQKNILALETKLFKNIEGSSSNTIGDIFLKRPENSYNLRHWNVFQIPS